ncbi:BA75_04469T0 [Komagataella pastoris]|uniref:BA75_04469T0 n=1 Tax=Komagataella pastoris TaxID=4922 RepID=A0A1B2JI16_PICPA|nr:BA75_04469T0 [Komagataella pastoris]
MGNDGGSIPKRRELLRLNESESQANRSKLSVKLNSWYYCSLSEEPLRYCEGKVVSDYRGRLYNKESVLKHLISKGNTPAHLKSLKDLVELRFCFKGDKILCPINKDIILDLNGENDIPAFVYLVPCGCVVSGKIAKEITKLKSKPLLCPVCNQPFEHTNVIPINPSDTTDLESRMARLRQEGLSHNLSRRHKKSRSYEGSGEPDFPKKRVMKAEKGCEADVPKPSKVIAKQIQ